MDDEYYFPVVTSSKESMEDSTTLNCKGIHGNVSKCI